MDNAQVKKEYRQVGVLHCDVRTAPEVGNVLSSLYQRGSGAGRVRIFIGDAKTGLAWTEEHEVMGYIGRSSGTYKVPLLIQNRSSSGGGALLDHCVVGIIDIESKRVLYKHPKFHLPPMVVKGKQLFVGGKLHADCASPDKATKLMEFLQGKRFAK